MMVFTTFANEIVLWHKGKYAIVEVDINGRRRLVVADDYFTDYIVEYGDGRWAMDHPEHWPKYVKARIGPIVERRIR